MSLALCLQVGSQASQHFRSSEKQATSVDQDPQNARRNEEREVGKESQAAKASDATTPLLLMRSEPSPASNDEKFTWTQCVG